ncbi:universal stress protein, partial [bacterium]|nr:universal stress protein [bacterium]
DKILLPLNDSSGMMKVAKYAIRVSLALKVSIEILTVTNKKDSDVVNRSKIDKLIKLIRRSGVAHFHKIEEGDIVEKIVNRAGKDKIIVMKASSMSPIQRFFKGSIPLSVMNECDVPILIVK